MTLLLLALMCENVNAAPQESVPVRIGASVVGLDSPRVESGPNATRGKEIEREPRFSAPAGVAPFMLAHPMCQTGFTIAMRYDQRNSAGAIIKSVWVRKCVRVPRIVYGGKI